MTSRGGEASLAARRILVAAPIILGIALGSFAAESEGAKADGSLVQFRDCADCPALVVVEPGSFLMGRQEDSRCRDEDDPVVEVKIAYRFAAGMLEVTVDEWAGCRREGGCLHDPRELNPAIYRDLVLRERADRPVTDVSWEDAQQYVRWLSAKTGEKYRLLSESEWLYVSSELKNGTNWYRWRWSLRPAKSLPEPDRFGLHGLSVGGVMEWLDDPGSPCFVEAPDASRQNDDLRVLYADIRILRGPSHCYVPRSLTGALRAQEILSRRDKCFGFRVARELPE